MNRAGVEVKIERKGEILHKPIERSCLLGDVIPQIVESKSVPTNFDEFFVCPCERAVSLDASFRCIVPDCSRVLAAKIAYAASREVLSLGFGPSTAELLVKEGLVRDVLLIHFYFFED